MSQTRIDPSTVVGWGVDADPENDPTYPMRDTSKDDESGLNWPRPALQPETVEVLMSTEHNRLPAVFGTSVPPSGLSGMIRREAFRRSEGKWSHWLMLLAADRINVVEGLLQDVANNRIPNIPGEMGIRSELRHNREAFVTKLAVAGALVGLAAFALREKRLRREARQEELLRRDTYL